MKIFQQYNDNLVDKIRKGAIGVLPTDTVYGLVCAAGDEAAVTRLYGLKNRKNKPGTIVAADIDQLVQLGIKRRYLTAVEQFWPNTISVIIPHDITYLHQGLGGQPFRIPTDVVLHNLLKQTGPLLTSSANMPGKAPAKTIREAQKIFTGKVDFYVDGGDLSSRESSTIIRIIDDAVEVIRQGSAKIDPRLVA